MDNPRVRAITGAVSHAVQPWWYALRLILFWLLFFCLFRIWFILWMKADWPAEGPWAALWKGLPLDISMAGYLLALPMLLWFAGLSLPARHVPISQHFLKGFHFFIIALLVLVFAVNIFVYEEWHTPLNNRALQYFRTPSSLFDSMSFGFKLGGLATYIFLTWGWWKIYNRLVGKHQYRPDTSLWQLGWAPVIGLLLLLSIRGGTGKMPINESAVYYSNSLFNNHAATNTAWHVVHSMIESRSSENHYRFMDDDVARKAKEQLLNSGNRETPHTWINLPENARPNIVFLIMESMTAQVMAELGGEPDVCPNLSRLAKEGILFTQCFGSGYRTDQGLVAVLSGFPAQPDQSVVLLQDKAAKLPSIPVLLKEDGYTSAFFYGGQLTFANIGVWLRHQSFDTILSEKDFPPAEKTQRWGVDDQHLFEKARQVLSGLPQPFFATVLTLSLHSPYDVPFESRWTGFSHREKFLNSAAFADHAIGEFFEKAAREPWYDNTLFVLVADHGHQQPGGINMNDPRARRVPLILAGPRIDPAWRGKRIDKIGNHHDLPATILNELGRSTASFSWSKDLLDPATPEFAYYSNENGLGWITPTGAAFYQFQDKSWKGGFGQTDSLQKSVAKGYLQTLYNEFLGL